MRTFKSLLQKGTELLKNAGIEEAGLDAWLLLEYLSGKSRAWYYAHDNEEADPETEEAYLAACGKRAGHVPLQHLTHKAYFMEYEFYVDQNVLIPRQDTETLVELARSILKKLDNPRILDMCTGSGCILISLLAYKEDCFGTGTDISPKALEIASRNAQRNGVADRAVFAESDLFSGPVFRKKDGEEPEKYDMLISNPPYIPTEDIRGLMEEVRLHDPVLALDGHGDGLYFYREITREAYKYLKPEGWLLYEIGCGQGKDVAALMRQSGFVSVDVKQDLTGLDRVVLGKMPPEAFLHQEDNHV